MKLREWLRRTDRKRNAIVPVVPNRADRRRGGFHPRRYASRPLVATRCRERLETGEHRAQPRHVERRARADA